MPGAISTFEVANPGDQNVGVSFGDTITALDAYGNVATGYEGAQDIVFTGPDIAPHGEIPVYPASVDFTLGVGTASGITLFDAETTSLTATQDPITGVSTPFSVIPGAISTFGVANPGTRTVGIGFDDTITALDTYGNVATSYVGTQVIAFTGPDTAPDKAIPTYPDSVSFALGVGTASGITLVDAETTALTATQSPVTGTSTTFLVNPGPASYYTVAAPSAATVAVPFPVTITADDTYGNPATAYSGTADLVSSLGAELPPSVSLTAGTVTFDATLGTAGIQTIGATDSVVTSITGVSADIDVSAASSTTYTVTYQSGAATSGSPPSDPNSPYAAGATVTVLPNSGDLGETGETFTGWNTQSNGLGVTYAPGATFAIEASTELYPVFSLVAPPTTYTVTYQSGAATSGSPPSDPNSPYAAGATVTVLPNSGDLGETGETFTGWNTQSNGLGVTYAPGATFAIEASTELYPVFSLVAPPTTYTVTYQSGAATSGSPPSDPNSPYAAGATVTVLPNSGDLGETGETFTGWNTQSNGLGVTYAPGATFAIEASTELYPVFSLVAPPTTYTVTYQSGAATSGSPPSDPNSPYAAGATVTVLPNSGDLGETGETFTGWNTQSNGLGVTYAPGATFAIEASTELYPVFSLVAPPTTYTVTYQSGAATSGSPPSDPNSPYAAGATVTVLPNSGDLAETGETFTGWNTQSNGLGVTYAPGVTFAIEASTELYPVFSLVAPPTTYTVTYQSGAATSGSPPSDPNSPYAAGATVTVLPNSGDLGETGETFTGWNTQSNGLGVTYAPGATFAIEASTELYPVFAANLRITTTFLAVATPGEVHYFQFLRGTGGVTPYTWSISAGILPKGLSLDPSSGVISGSVSLSATAETFTVELTDANGASVTRQFTITVKRRFFFTCPNFAHSYQGRWFVFQMTTWGSEGHNFAESGRLPKGVTFDPVTGTLSGTPARATTGTYNLVITASTSDQSASLAFTLDVSSPSS